MKNDMTKLKINIIIIKEEMGKSEEDLSYLLGCLFQQFNQLEEKIIAYKKKAIEHVTSHLIK